jgi:molybdopterin/thiamine biosynthesis adenylyltransferase
MKTNTFKSKVLDYKIPKQRAEISALVDNVYIEVFDTLNQQVEELAKCRLPKYPLKRYPEKYSTFTKKYFEKYDTQEEAGLWIYYPWRNRLVRTLEKEEFIEVRTNRNKYKITQDEQEILAKKSIGIVGLSVGRSVAVNIAMERIAGKIKLADFDELELSNYNRIQTSLSELGLNKAVSAAREIAEIDPFLEVEIFTEGLTRDNMTDFFQGNGGLNLLIEESDGLDMKILAREEAKKLGIPVLMEASDRCMIDIERFDLEPNRPILHGLVGDLDTEMLSTLKTNEEKMPYMLAIVGIDKLSKRIKASMLEIEQSITTWPQLASAVSMGGGVTADLARRILLDQLHVSGRYYIDVEELISNNTPQEQAADQEEKKESLTPDSAKELLRKKKKTGQPAPDKVLNQIMEAGHWAPSGGNAQPWVFVKKDERLHLFLDKKLGASFLNYKERASLIALGACAQNMYLKAAELGYKAKFKICLHKEHVASLSLKKSKDSPKEDAELAKYIYHRTSNRLITSASKIEEDKLQYIRKTVEAIPGAGLRLFSKPDQKMNIAQVLAAMERIRMLTDAGHKSFIDEMRWTREEALQTGDGVDINTVELTAAEHTGFKIAKDYAAIKLLRDWEKGHGFEKLMLKGIMNSYALGYIYMRKRDKENYFMGGRALENAWIAAAKVNLGFQAQSPSTFLFARYLGLDLTSFKGFEKELPLLRKTFEKELNIQPGEGEIFLFRLFNSPRPQVLSLRRPISNQFINLDKHG